MAGGKPGKVTDRKRKRWEDEDVDDGATMRLLRRSAITLLVLVVVGGVVTWMMQRSHGPAGPKPLAIVPEYPHTVTANATNPARKPAASATAAQPADYGSSSGSGAGAGSGAGRGSAADAGADQAPPGYTPMNRVISAPPTRFFDNSGRKTELADFTGRVVLLNLWATWCAPCVKELPGLDRLQARLGGQDFQVVAVSVDQGGRSTVEPFLARRGVRNLQPYFDPESKVLAIWHISNLPTSILISRDGRILGKIEGDTDWDSQEAVDMIQHMITRTAPAGRRPSGVINTSG